MDEATVSSVAPASPPPSYSEALQPSTPPPTYGEAVGVVPVQSDTEASPFPILSIPTAATPAHHTQRVRVQPSPGQVTPQQQVTITLGDAPTVLICPYCHRQITTSVNYKPGSAAWAMCCLLTLFGCLCGICLIPFCIKEFQDAHHYCPECKRFIGTCVG